MAQRSQLVSEVIFCPVGQVAFTGQTALDCKGYSLTQS